MGFCGFRHTEIIEGLVLFRSEQGMTFLDGSGVPRVTAFTITPFADGLSTKYLIDWGPKLVTDL